MPTITIQSDSPESVIVTVADDQNGSRTEHTVSYTTDLIQRYGGDPENVEGLIRESFHFLLEREPKESILPSFSLDVIERYFPEFAEEIVNRMRSS